MTLLQAMMIIVGVGFGLALISSINTWYTGAAGNTAVDGKPSLAELAIPFALKWALFSGGVALALGVQYLLLTLRA